MDPMEGLSWRLLSLGAESTSHLLTLCLFYVYNNISVIIQLL